MKNKLFLVLLITAFAFISCSSNKLDVEDDEIYYEGDEGFTNVIEAEEIKEDFLGDFNPVQLESLMVLVKNLNKLNPREITNINLVPRKNTIEMTFRYGPNVTTLILNQAERNKITEAAKLFLSQYEEKTLPRHKVSKDTAYFTSKCTLYWGVAGTNNGSRNNAYYANVEIFQKHAYFILHFMPSRNEEGQEDSFTPKTRLYLSPSQVRELIARFDQEYLNAQVKYLEKKAYVYD